MPVVSPHRGSASTLTGNYRSSISTTTGIDRPYYNPTTGYNPRITSSYSERFVTRTYTDSDGKRIFSRSGSITEDGITTRYRDESRDFVTPSTSSSLRRESRDLSIGSDYTTTSRRDSSLTRDQSSLLNNRLSTVNVIESVAELRNKYSPANYIPACQRNNRKNNDLLGRSKSINDIGLPPIDSTTLTTTNNPSTLSTTTTKLNQKKKVNDGLNLTTGVVLLSNNTNDDLINDGDDNGNRTQSVADLRKKFDDKTTTTTMIETIKQQNGDLDATPIVKISENLFKKQDQNRINNKTTTINRQINNTIQENGDNSDDIDDNIDNINGLQKNTSRVNNFASYIPSKDYLQQQQLNGSNIDEFDDNISNNSNNNIINNNIDGGSSRQEVNKRVSDIGTSPKLSIISSSTTTTANNLNNSNSLTRRSIERNNDDLLLDSSATTSTTSSTLSTRLTTSSPSSRTTTQSTSINQLGLNGLKNIGNTCFMNSVIQCLSNTKLLLEYLLNDQYLKDINTTISSMKGALIRSFAEVIKELWSSEKIGNVVNTTSLKSQIQRFAPRFMGYSQQDAQEFLRYLLEGLHEDVNRIIEKSKLKIINDYDYDKLNDNEKSLQSWQRYLQMDNSKIVDCFVGQLKSTLKCTYCGHCSVTFDPFWDLSLPIPQRIGQIRLSQCLDSFTREETLDGDEKPTCSKCKERRKCTKSFTIQKFPKILVIHLKRFSLAERFRGKLSVTIDFPLEGLDMSNYAADNVTPCRYNLYAISNHSGTTYSGHYTAYCRHPYSKTWHEYNDSRVSQISSKSVVSGEAYVLFYEQDGQKSHL